MKDFENLSRFEKSVLSACCKANYYSLRSHVALGYIRKKIQKKDQKYFKKAIKTLVSSGFISEHPARRGTTYGLTPDGLKWCNLLKKELENGN